MKVTVIGKFRKQGVSRKTGEVYDICNAYVTHPLRGAEGLVSEKLFLSPEQFDVDGIQIGKAYNLDYDSNGFVMDFSLI